MLARCLIGPFAPTLLLGTILVACGGNATEGAGGGGSGAAGGAGGSTSTAGSGPGTGGSGAGVSGDWELLLEGDWSLDPGLEAYTCVVATVPEEMFVHAFRPVAPEGTHHTVLTVGNIGEDGTFPCSAGTNGQNMIYGSGVGTEAGVMPPGVAVKLEAGSKLLLNLHLFNVSTDTITGTSGIEIQRIEPDDVVYEATSVLAGPLDLNIPAQSTVTETGYCTMPTDTTIFAVGPHMHQLGTHMTVTAQMAGGDEVMHDAPYTFDDQRHVAIDPPLQLSAGDQVKVDCTYNNTTNSSVGFGDSSNQEMCFAGLFLYPADAALGFICTN
jgi:Copper type II ascorbate-dependent monooxygenase, C-terminal domain